MFLYNDLIVLGKIDYNINVERVLTALTANFSCVIFLFPNTNDLSTSKLHETFYLYCENHLRT